MTVEELKDVIVYLQGRIEELEGKKRNEATYTHRIGHDYCPISFYSYHGLCDW